MKTLMKSLVLTLVLLGACDASPTAPYKARETVAAPLGYYMTQLTRTPEFRAMLALRGSDDVDALHRAAQDLLAIWPDMENDKPWCLIEDPRTPEGVAYQEIEGDEDPCEDQEFWAVMSLLTAATNLYACAGWPGYHCYLIPVTMWAYLENTALFKECMCLEGVFSDLAGDVFIVPEDYSPDTLGNTIGEDDVTTVEEYCGDVEGWEAGEGDGGVS